MRIAYYTCLPFFPPLPVPLRQILQRHNKHVYLKLFTPYNFII